MSNVFQARLEDGGDEWHCVPAKTPRMAALIFMTEHVTHQPDDTYPMYVEIEGHGVLGVGTEFYICEEPA